MVVSPCASSTAEVPKKTANKAYRRTCSSSQLPAQHFYTTPSRYFSYTPERISATTQNECKTAVRLSTHFKLQGKRNYLPFQWNGKKHSHSEDPHWWGVLQQGEHLPRLCLCPQWRVKPKSALLGHFHKKEPFAPQPLSAFLRFFPFMLCRSGLEVTAESTGSWKNHFFSPITWRYFYDKQTQAWGIGQLLQLLPTTYKVWNSFPYYAPSWHCCVCNKVCSFTGALVVLLLIRYPTEQSSVSSSTTYR